MKNLIDQSYIRVLVKNHISSVKKRNPLFSMRAYAKKLGISVGGLSSFLSGKADYSVETLEKLVTDIVVSPEERKDILKEYNIHLLDRLSARTKSSNYDYRLLKEDEMAFIKDWYHYAILFLIRTKDFKLDILWIAKRLSISSSEVELALSRLVHLKLIVINPDQTVTLQNNAVKTTDDVANNSLRIMHKQMLYLAGESLDNDPIDLRDVISLTLPVNLKNIPKAKEVLRRCQDDLMALLPDDEMSEVYHVLFALYPVSKPVIEAGPQLKDPTIE